MSGPRLALAAALLLALFGARPARADLHVLIVSGIGGEPRYEEQFARNAEAIAQATRRGVGDPARVVLLSGASATAEAVTAKLRALRSTLRAQDELALILIGHGSWDGEQYKFNLAGPDLSALDLAQLLKPLRASRQLVVDTSSASGAALVPLQAKGRIVITATRSGNEQSAPQFANYWAQALASDSADLDKDGWITAQEAFEFTSRRVADHYKRDVSLATEHPQIEGEAGKSLRLARAVPGSGGRAAPVEEPGPAVSASLLERRSALERDVAALRERKTSMKRDAYLNALEAVLVELAELEDRIEQAGGVPPGGAP